MAVHLTTGYPLKQGSTEIQLANLQQVVTSLIDELGHILYNLDSGNVLESARDKVLTKELSETKEELDGKITENKTSIKQTADTIELHAESIEKHNETLSQHSASIGVNAKKIELHAESIEANKNNIASVELTADGIQARVSELEDSTTKKFTEVNATAKGITSRVVNLETFKESRFTQTIDGFELDGDRSVFTGAIALTDNAKAERFAIYHDESNTDEPKVYLKNTTTERADIIIGEGSDSLESDVYIGSNVNTQRVATQGWVKEYVKDNAVAVYA